MRFKILCALFFIIPKFIVGQQVIPKAELADSSSWRSHEGFIGGGIGSACYNIEFGYRIGEGIFSSKAAYFGFGLGELFSPNRDEDNLHITESPIYTIFFDFKYSSGLGFITGLDFSKRIEIDKNIEISKPLEATVERTVTGPFIGISKVFPNSKIGIKALVGTSRKFSLMLNFGF